MSRPWLIADPNAPRPRTRLSDAWARWYARQIEQAEAAGISLDAQISRSCAYGIDRRQLQVDDPVD